MGCAYNVQQIPHIPAETSSAMTASGFGSVTEVENVKQEGGEGWITTGRRNGGLIYREDGKEGTALSTNEDTVLLSELRHHRTSGSKVRASCLPSPGPGLEPAQHPAYGKCASCHQPHAHMKRFEHVNGKVATTRYPVVFQNHTQYFQRAQGSENKSTAP